MKSLGALVAVVVGLAVLYWVGKRRHQRTNSAGVEQFKSYTNKVLVTALEKFAWAAAIACVVIGGFLTL